MENTATNINSDNTKPLSRFDFIGTYNDQQKERFDMIRAKYREVEALIRLLPDWEASSFSGEELRYSMEWLHLSCQKAIGAVAFEGKNVT